MDSLILHNEILILGLKILNIIFLLYKYIQVYYHLELLDKMSLILMN